VLQVNSNPNKKSGQGLSDLCLARHASQSSDSESESDDNQFNIDRNRDKDYHSLD